MTHYNIDYSTMTEPEKSAKAIQDIKDYLGEETFDKVTADMKQVLYPFEQFRMCMAFMAGIEGFPVVAWYESVYGVGTAIEVDAEAVTEG